MAQTLPPRLADMSDTESKQKRPLKGRVFQCTGFPNCSKLFTRLEHLARHRRKHTGERPFTCPHCSKNFSRLDNLRQHKQTVHAYENYIKKRLLLQTPQQPQAQSPLQYSAPAHMDSLPGTPLLYAPMGGHVTKLIASPPNSGSPHYGSVYYSGYYSQSALGFGSPLPPLDARDRLRDPPKFNPKNRPRPLSLVHLSVDDNLIHARSSAPAVMVEPPMKTAPAVPSFPQLYRSDSFRQKNLRLPYMNPMIVSPLSPLFHQSFNQVARSSSPHFAGHPPLMGSHASRLLSTLQTPSPTVLLPPIGGSKSSDSVDSTSLKNGWLKNVLNNDDKLDTKPPALPLSKVTINNLLSNGSYSGSNASSVTLNGLNGSIAYGSNESDEPSNGIKTELAPEHTVSAEPSTLH